MILNIHYTGSEAVSDRSTCWRHGQNASLPKSFFIPEIRSLQRSDDRSLQRFLPRSKIISVDITLTSIVHYHDNRTRSPSPAPTQKLYSNKDTL